MSGDKIAEIRERHERGPRAMLPLTGYAEAHTDRATLLAEVERLRAERDDLLTENMKLHSVVGAVRAALEAKP